MPFAGLRVLSLESRRTKDMESLILRQGGVPFVAPSVKERAAEDDSAALQFVEQLEAGAFDMVVCMTGVGIAFLRDLATTKMPVERFAAALRRATIVARGPKPVVVLRALQVPIDVLIPEPNTWREVVAAIASRPERQIAIQEYGRSNTEMVQALQALGATVTTVAPYRWELPDDLEPLKQAAMGLAQGKFDVVLFTSSIQLDHLLEVAKALAVEEKVMEALGKRVVIASIGPIMTEALTARGLKPKIVPETAKIGALVVAAAEQAHLHRRP
jgi:uroporphyrinogen-III synthase